MGKILNVDFKNKRLEYTWDDLHQQRLVKQIELDLQSVMDNAIKLLGKKDAYAHNLAHQFACIIVNLKEKT